MLDLQYNIKKLFDGNYNRIGAIVNISVVWDTFYYMVQICLIYISDIVTVFMFLDLEINVIYIWCNLYSYYLATYLIDNNVVLFHSLSSIFLDVFIVTIRILYWFLKYRYFGLFKEFYYTNSCLILCNFKKFEHHRYIVCSVTFRVSFDPIL
ncbi:hypothetical protein HZS_6224 [Henneguya salminicola]|nr:hypothetical protein HZS_6224 [Henneguya salminicola]